MLAFYGTFLRAFPFSEVLLFNVQSHLRLNSYAHNEWAQGTCFLPPLSSLILFNSLWDKFLQQKPWVKHIPACSGLLTARLSHPPFLIQISPSNKPISYIQLANMLRATRGGIQDRFTTTWAGPHDKCAQTYATRTSTTYYHDSTAVFDPVAFQAANQASDAEVRD
jgi:hypothetical protein